LEAFRINEYKQNDHVDLFEIAKVYLANQNENDLPHEPCKLAIVSQRDYLGLKGVVEALVGMLNPKAIFDARLCDLEILDLTYSAELLLDGQRLGWIGEASDDAKELFRFKRDATVAELDMQVLNEIAVSETIHGIISPFPAITRDFNFVVAESVRWGDLASSVRKASGDLLESISYKETFRNPKKDGDNKKRVLLSVVLRSAELTLTGEQAEETCQKIVEVCQREHAANLAV